MIYYYLRPEETTGMGGPVTLIGVANAEIADTSINAKVPETRIDAKIRDTDIYGKVLDSHINSTITSVEIKAKK